MQGSQDAGRPFLRGAGLPFAPTGQQVSHVTLAETSGAGRQEEKEF